MDFMIELLIEMGLVRVIAGIKCLEEIAFHLFSLFQRFHGDLKIRIKKEMKNRSKPSYSSAVPVLIKFG